MKKLLCKTGTYQKDGQEKNEYTKLGVLMDGNEGGQYIILDPTVNLAGVLLKQNALAATQGKPQRDSVMVSVFDDSQQQQGGYQQPPQQQQPQYRQPAQAQAPQQGGFAPQDNDVPF